VSGYATNKKHKTAKGGRLAQAFGIRQVVGHRVSGRLSQALGVRQLTSLTPDCESKVICPQRLGLLKVMRQQRG